MLTDTDIININKTLSLCGVQRLTTQEIDFLNAIGTTIADVCDKYKTCQAVLLDRLKNKTCNGSALSRLKKLSKVDGCSLEEKQPERPPATIMYIGGGLV